MENSEYSSDINEGQRQADFTNAIIIAKNDCPKWFEDTQELTEAQQALNDSQFKIQLKSLLKNPQDQEAVADALKRAFPDYSRYVLGRIVNLVINSLQMIQNLESNELDKPTLPDPKPGRTTRNGEGRTNWPY